MTMDTAYRLVGYDTKTERLAVSYPIAPQHLPPVQRTAGLTTAAASEMGDWPLSDEQAHQIAAIIGAPVDLHRHDYFLEPYAATAETA
jgi:hypothetical protein